MGYHSACDVFDHPGSRTWFRCQAAIEAAGRRYRSGLTPAVTEAVSRCESRRIVAPMSTISGLAIGCVRDVEMALRDGDLVWCSRHGDPPLRSGTAALSDLRSDPDQVGYLPGAASARNSRSNLADAASAIGTSRLARKSALAGSCPIPAGRRGVSLISTLKCESEAQSASADQLSLLIADHERRPKQAPNASACCTDQVQTHARRPYNQTGLPDQEMSTAVSRKCTRRIWSNRPCGSAMIRPHGTGQLFPKLPQID